ncbi:MAG: S1 RNA-binding domain-containing protein [Patescibacteria group bacterium]|nr:S1 RNA-binding domain-containing protein [Patescibacteria group bacterium]
MITTQTTNDKLDALTQIIKNEPELVSFLKEGDLVEAEYLKKTPKAAYFDLGKFGTGVVFGAELSNAKDVLKNLKKGEKTSAKVSSPENEEGFIELSLADAHKQKGWQELKNIVENDEVLTIKIIGANTGGLVANINDIKAFLPVSQLSNKNYPRIETKTGQTDETNQRNEILKELRKLVNQELKVDVCSPISRTNKLIISEKAGEEEDIKKLLENYKAGDIIEGIISGIADFGAFVRFVDNPSIEGFIHISEFDHKIIENLKDIVKIDDTVKVKIVEIKDSQVNLSLKTLKADPWEKIEEKLKEGQEIKGVVGKFNPFGALVNLENDLQGAIHVSEFGGLEEMKKQIEPNKEYTFVVSSLKPQEKRILLKLKKEE